MNEDIALPRSYVIRSIKAGIVWQNGYGEYQSYTMALEGFGEPVRMSKSMPVQLEPAPGDMVFGHIEERSADASDRMYYEFRSDKKPSVTVVYEEASRIAKLIEPRDDDVAPAQPGYDHEDVKWAIKLATDVWIAQDCPENDITSSEDLIENQARYYLEMMIKLQGDN